MHMYVVSQLLQSGTNANRGVFNTPEELDRYERIWHYDVYQPTWNELKDKVFVNTIYYRILNTGLELH